MATMVSPARRARRSRARSVVRRPGGGCAAARGRSTAAGRTRARRRRCARPDARARTAHVQYGASPVRGRARTAQAGADPERQSMSHAGGGSPARTSWLPRTSVIDSAAWAARHCVNAACSAGTRPAAACRKSPSTTSRVAAVRSIRASSRARSFAVAPRGIATPPARKAAALPRWTSATNNVRARGQNSARSARSSTVSPASVTTAAPARIDNSCGSRRLGGAGGEERFHGRSCHARQS